ncbi:MAG: hypothetical protein AAGE96_12100 [Cyanobacteria bacterium P01_G01_bin.19]
MPKNKHNLPKHLRLGKTAKSQEAKTPKGTSNGGRIVTNLQEINWTRNKLTLTIIALSTPYLIATVGSFAVGNSLVGFIFIGLGVLVIGMYLLLRYIERSDF